MVQIKKYHGSIFFLVKKTKPVRGGFGKRPDFLWVFFRYPSLTWFCSKPLVFCKHSLNLFPQVSPSDYDLEKPEVWKIGQISRRFKSSFRQRPWFQYFCVYLPDKAQTINLRPPSSAFFFTKREDPRCQWGDFPSHPCQRTPEHCNDLDWNRATILDFFLPNRFFRFSSNCWSTVVT